jgi:uncharacterized protein
MLFQDSQNEFFFQIEAFDWNCSQYIVPRFSEEEVRGVLEPLKRRIAELELRIQAGG